MKRAWWIARGPNGGYVAAILVRALEAEVRDPRVPPRSITIHYLRPPAEGEVEISVTVERAGRTVTALSARMLQEGRVMALALAAFAGDRPGPSFDDTERPTVPPPEALEDTPRPVPVPLRQQYRERWAIGSPPVDGVVAPAADVGGWIRLVEPAPVDYALVAALTDAWVPSAFTRFEVRAPAPTLDLTIHFREPPPGTDDWSLVRVRSKKSFQGFLEEDGEIWSRDGKLLAQSRQLALIL